MDQIAGYGKSKDLEWIDSLPVIRKKGQHTIKVNRQDRTVYLTFPKFTTEGLVHGVSTRLGGVSEGIYASMNLSFTRGDNEEAVRENYRRIGEAIGFDPNQLVCSDQIHETKIQQVTSDDRGRGILYPRIAGIDGLVTKEIGVPLATFYADCVPLLFYDPVQRVAGMAHSGWRGTVARIGAKMVSMMQETYGCVPGNILAAVGPSICQECYEVSEDVALEFQQEFTKEQVDEFLQDDCNGKFHLDLWKVNEILLKEAGIQEEHLDITDLCTCCNPKLLFSHRASQGKRGNIGAFLMLTE